MTKQPKPKTRRVTMKVSDATVTIKSVVYPLGSEPLSEDWNNLVDRHGRSVKRKFGERRL